MPQRLFLYVFQEMPQQLLGLHLEMTMQVGSVAAASSVYTSFFLAN
jgi:hypothetical protein